MRSGALAEIAPNEWDERAAQPECGLPWPCAARTEEFMNKVFTAALFASLLLFQPVGAVAGGTADPVCGDVNDSGSVNTSDALLTLRKGVGQQVTLDCSAYDDRYAMCQSSLTTTNTNLSTCNANLSTTNADLIECSTGTKCGDGIVNSVGEQCDDEDLGGSDCTDLGHGAGTLECDEGCKFDTSACTPCPEGSTFFNGACWLLGAVLIDADLVGSCDVACASIGRECDEPALQLVGSAGNDETCRAAVDAADPENAPHAISSEGPYTVTGCGPATDYATGCVVASGLEPEEINGAFRFLYEGSGTLCAADHYGGFCATPARRACACKP
jgi:hypothetical protein